MLAFIKEKVVDVQENLKNNKNGTVIYLNPSTYIYFRKNLDLINNVDGVRFDGFFMTSLLKLFGVKVPKRQSFDMTSLAPLVFEKAEREGSRVFFCGGKGDDVINFTSIMKDIYPKLNVVGSHHGYFCDDEYLSVQSKILASSPDIILLGLGGKKQEIVASKLSQQLDASIYTCGAFISQTTKRLEYYPHFINMMNLRWLYRFYKEPHTLRRVISTYPLFCFYLMFDFVMFKLNRS